MKIRYTEVIPINRSTPLRQLGSTAALQEALSSLSSHFKQANDVENFRLVIAVESALFQLVDMLKEATFAYKAVSSSYAHLLYNFHELLALTMSLYETAADATEGDDKQKVGNILEELRKNPGVHSLASQGKRYGVLSADISTIKDSALADWLSKAPYTGTALDAVLDKEVAAAQLEPPRTEEPYAEAVRGSSLGDVETIRKLVKGSLMLWGTSELPPFLKEGQALLDRLEKVNG